MQHLAKIVLLVTVAHFLALRLHFVLQGASPWEDKATAQTVQLDTCVHHGSKGLHDVHLGAQHLVRLGKSLAQHARQASSVPTQSKLISVWALCQVIQILITTTTTTIMLTSTMMTTMAMTMMINFYFRSNATACANGSYSVGKSVQCLACPAGHKCPTTDVCI